MTDSNNASPDDAKQEKTKTPRTRGQKWRRRTIALLLGVIVAFCAARALTPLLLPTVLRKVAASYGLDAKYDRFDFNMLGADVGLWNLRLVPKEGGEAVLSIDYCRGAVDTLALLRGKLHVDRVEAEGASVTLERTADGHLPLVERFLASAQKNAKQPAATSATTQPIDIPLESPLAVRALRLQHAQARLIDRAVSPATDVKLDLNLIVNNIGSLDQPTKFSVQLGSPQILGALYVDGEATARDKHVKAQIATRMFGLNLQPLKSYLAAIGLTPTANSLAATANGTLTITPADDGAKSDPTQPAKPTTAVAIHLNLADLQLSADSREAASAKSVIIDIPTAAPGEVRIESVLIDGVRAHASRDAEGRPAIAGIAIGSEPSTQPVIASKPVADPAKKPATTEPASTPANLPIVSLRKFQARDVELSIDDDAVSPSNHLALNLSDFTIANVSSDPKEANVAATISLDATVPGLAKSIRLKGDINAAKPIKTIAMKVHADGIDPVALDPYLAPLGVSRAMHDAHFDCDLSANAQLAANGAIRLGAKMSQLTLADAQREWFGFPSVVLNDIEISEGASRIRLGDIAISGPKITITRAEGGEITTLGFKFDPSKVAQTSSPQPTPSSTVTAATAEPAASTTINLPALEVGKLNWNGVTVSLSDRQVSPPVDVTLKDVSVELADLVLDVNAEHASKNGSFKVRVSAPQIVDSFAIDGTLAPSSKALSLEVKGEARGITLAAIKPTLATFGIEPVMQSGALDFAMHGYVQQKPKLLEAALLTDRVSLVDGSTQWLALDKMTCGTATFDGQTAQLARLSLDGPSLHVERDENGHFEALGMKLVPPTVTASAKPAAPSTAPLAKSPTQVDLSLPIIAKLGQLELKQARIDALDRAVNPPAALSATASVKLDNLVLGADAPPATFRIDAAAPGVVGQAKIDGTLLTSPHRQGVEANVAITGISGSALQPYLPPGLSPSMTDGTFAGQFAGRLEPNSDGGSRVSLLASDLRLDDALQIAPPFKLMSAKLLVDRVDLPANVIAIKEISTDGLSARVFENDRGIVVPGLLLRSSPNLGPSTQPVRTPTTQAAAGEASDVNALVSTAKVKPPHITIEKLSIKADRLGAQLKALAEPVAVTSLNVSSQNIDLLGDNPAARPPIELNSSLTIEKLVDSIALHSTLAPFAQEPSANLHLAVGGIHANQITSLLPALATHLNFDGLSDGAFTTDIESQFNFTKRGMFGIDLSRDVGAEVTIKNTKLTQAGDEATLAGVEEVRAGKIVFSPASGDLSVKSLDITKPAAHIVRDAAGIHALGVLVKIPSATTKPSDAEADKAVAATAETQGEPAPPQHGASARIDSLTVDGIDLTVEDRVGTPTTVLPVKELDAEIKGIDTRALREPLPIKFSVLAGSGKVALKNEDGSERPAKEVFAQFAAGGELKVFPKPVGWVKASLGAFDLATVRGIAQEFGIKLGGGSFDFAVDARMNGADTFAATLYPTFNELRVSDSPDGKIQKFLKIGVPLDAGIVAVEDDDGAISLPVPVTIDAGKIDIGEIVASAAGAVGVQIMKGVAAMPLKAAAMIGLNFGGDKKLLPVVVPFSAGNSFVASEDRVRVAAFIQRMKSDANLNVTLVHALGNSDLKTSEQRANPSSADAAALAGQLRAKKLELIRQRVEETEALRAALGAQNESLANETMIKLRETSSAIDSTESSLDEMLGFLRPGAQSQADRRTKSAAIQLGQFRLDELQAMFKAAGLSNRVKVQPPGAKLPVESPATPNATGEVTLIPVRVAKGSNG